MDATSTKHERATDARDRRHLLQDLTELEALLQRAHRESHGTPDDVLAQRLFNQLIQRRRSQLRCS